jgi:hypothetical protein
MLLLFFMFMVLLIELERKLNEWFGKSMARGCNSCIFYNFCPTFALERYISLPLPKHIIQAALKEIWGNLGKFDKFGQHVAGMMAEMMA